MILNFLYSLGATLGFAIVFNVPKKYLLISAIGGALGWIGYTFLGINIDSPVTASFLASTIIGVWGEFLSVREKTPVTLFIIPGIIPLVPGSGMYYTMLAMIEGNFEKAAITGSETLFIAGSIASALIMVSSISRAIRGRKLMVMDNKRG